MQTTHTDSAIVETHEDGSKTITTVEHWTPPTRAEKAQAWGGIVALTVVALSPLALPWVADKLEERRERKARKTNLKSVED